jgi:hypothetical protein
VSSETAALVQTIILAITGTVVVWYTWETRQIRKETAKANRLISEQLAIALRKDREYRREALRRAQPSFSWGGEFSGNRVRLHSNNGGAPITGLKIRPIGPLTATVEPPYVGEGHKVQVSVSGLAEPAHEQSLAFVLSYKDSLGVPREMVIEYHPTERQWSSSLPSLEKEFADLG